MEAFTYNKLSFVHCVDVAKTIEPKYINLHEFTYQTVI